MKVTVSELLDAAPVLQVLGSSKLPARAAYHVARLVDILTPEINRAVEARLKLYREYGIERRKCWQCQDLYGCDLDHCSMCGAVKAADEKSLVHQIPPARETEFRAEIVPLLASSIEVGFDSLPLSMIEAMQLTPSEMHGLLPFLDGE